MDEGPALRRDNVTYNRDSAFSYVCHACCRCCHDKVIQLNPYEVARLAQNRGMSTTDFLARYTERSGTALRRVEQGACVFLTPQGCGVHSDRPLVCRLYPLGRRVTGEGGEHFLEVQPHPETEGEYGVNGTVRGFLDRQGAGPFIDAADWYAELVGRLSNALHARVEHDAQLTQDVQAVLEETKEEGQGHRVPDWLDMDHVVKRYCVQQQLPVPTDMISKMQLHIQAIETWVREQSIQTEEG